MALLRNYVELTRMFCDALLYKRVSLPRPPSGSKFCTFEFLVNEYISSLNEKELEGFFSKLPTCVTIEAFLKNPSLYIMSPVRLKEIILRLDHFKLELEL